MRPFKLIDYSRCIEFSYRGDWSFSDGISVRYVLAAFLLFILQLSSGPAAFAQSAGTCAGMTAGQLTSLKGFVPFPSSSPWNTDISSAPVDSNSTNIINYIGSRVTLHPDFGSGTYANQTIGIPYQVMAGAQLKVNVKLSAYASESDPGPMPVPSKALIEGYPNPGNGDRHVLVLEKNGCWLYELYHASLLKNGQWSADSTAIWDMTIDEKRPYTWTSADAAGLPIFAGLARYDEVAAGAIKHALRFTVPVTRKAFTPPASHWASSVTDPNAPAMGARPNDRRRVAPDGEKRQGPGERRSLRAACRGQDERPRYVARCQPWNVKQQVRRRPAGGRFSRQPRLRQAVERREGTSGA